MECKPYSGLQPVRTNPNGHIKPVYSGGVNADLAAFTMPDSVFPNSGLLICGKEDAIMTKNGKTALSVVATLLLVGAAVASGVAISKATQDTAVSRPWQSDAPSPTTSVSSDSGQGGGTTSRSSSGSTAGSSSEREKGLDDVEFEEPTVYF